MTIITNVYTMAQERFWTGGERVKNIKYKLRFALKFPSAGGRRVRRWARV